MFNKMHPLSIRYILGKPGQSSCSSCAPGTYSGYGATFCQKCWPGTSSDKSYGSTSCIACPTGYYAGEGYSSYSLPDKSKCEICKAGTYSDSGATACTVCKAGT